MTRAIVTLHLMCGQSPRIRNSASTSSGRPHESPLVVTAGEGLRDRGGRGLVAALNPWVASEIDHHPHARPLQAQRNTANPHANCANTVAKSDATGIIR